MYEYKATVVRVIDGDTVLLDLDLGFYMIARMSCRLAGLNSIELSQPGGSAAKTHLASLLPAGAALAVTSVKADKYAGRLVRLPPRHQGRPRSSCLRRCAMRMPARSICGRIARR
jgi:endonuclease YncB( thermonuclease family)